MRLLVIFLLVSLHCTISGVYANSNTEARRKEIFAIIDRQIKDANRLIKHTRGRSPEHYLRIAELYLEKARLIKEQENAKYLSLSPAERRRSGKRKYFRNSDRYLKKANNICLNILKRYKNFKRKGEVYYILAYNAKEYNDNKRALRYFKSAARSRNIPKSLRKKARLATAEIYHSEKKYKKAIPLYESVLQGKKSKWYTKDLYNLSWSYFKTGRKDKAIAKMREVHRLSKNSKFIDMREYVEKDIVYFYADVGRVEDAVKFYKGIGKDIHKNLVKVAKGLKNRGEHSKARKILQVAKRHSKSDKSKVVVNIELLSLYRKSGNIKGHLEASGKLVSFLSKGLVDEKQKKTLMYHLKVMSSTLQRQAIGKKSKYGKKAKKEKGRYAVKYYMLLSQVNKDKGYQSVFFAAETLYAMGQYDEAIEKYVTVYKKSSESGDRKIQDRSLKGILAGLGQKSASPAIKKKYNSFGYNTYLKKYPRGKKSNVIYQRLFKEHIKSKDTALAESLFNRYQQYYPREISTQEAMLARIMDIYKNQNNRAGILKWVKKINNGEVSVSKKYAKKVNELLLSLQFADVSKATSVGDKKKALGLYLDLYSRKDSGPQQKKMAAYNIAVLLHDLAKGSLTYKWSKRALELMSESDVKQYDTSFFLMADTLFGLRMISEAAHLNRLMLGKLCRAKYKKKRDLYKNSVILYLSNNDIGNAQKIINSGAKCGISPGLQNDMRMNLMRSLQDGGKWRALENIVGRLEQNPKNHGDLILPLSKLRTAYYKRGRVEEAREITRKIMKHYESSRKKGRSIPLEALDIVAGYRVNDLRKEVKAMSKIVLSFPEKTFNQQLKAKFAVLANLKGKIDSLVSIGSGKGIVRGYLVLINSYNELIREISSFVPPGKSQDYIASFRKSMNEVTSPLRGEVDTFSRKAKELVLGQQILTFDNHKLFAAGEIDIRYYPQRRGVLMDKGGGQ